MLTAYSIALVLVYIHLAYFCLLWTSWIGDRRHRTLLFLLFLLAFSIRILVSLIVTQRYGEFYPDEGFYFQTGIRIVKDLDFPYFLQTDKLVSYVGSVNIAYPLINAYHVLLYPDPFLCKVTNCFISAFLLLPVYCLASKLFSQRVGLISATIAALWPNLIYWSAFNLKDILVAFWILFSIVLYYRCVKSKVTFGRVLFLILSLLLLLSLRIYVGLLLIFLVGAHSILMCRLRGVKKAATVLLLLLSVYMIFTAGHIGSFVRYAMNLEVVSNLIEQSFSKTAAHGYFMGSFDPKSFLTLPISAAHFLFTPSPFRITFESIRDFIKCNNIVWYGMFPFFIIGIYNLCKSRFKDAFLIVFFVLGLVLFYSFFPNLGMVRHRDQLIPLLIIVSVFGFYSRVKYKVALVWFIWLGLFVGILSFEMKYYFDLV